jgi:hypothetical protein
MKDPFQIRTTPSSPTDLTITLPLRTAATPGVACAFSLVPYFTISLFHYFTIL